MSSRWQQEVLETVWNVVNHDRDRDDEGKVQNNFENLAKVFSFG